MFVIAFEIFVCAVFVMMMVPYFTRARASSFGAPAKYVFLAHWVETYTCLLKFKRWQHMHKNPHDVELSPGLLFLCALYSFCSLVSPMSHEVVDVYDFKGARTEIWLVNAYAWHFQIPKWLGGLLWAAYARWKMKWAVIEANRRGVKLVGLGALTKHHQLTDDGMWYVGQLGDKRPKLAHGDTVTMAALFHLSMRLLQHMGVSAVFLTGATSKIGRALAVRLARTQVHVYLYSNGKHSDSEITEVLREAGDASKYLHHTRTFAELKLCRVCVTGKERYAEELINNAIPGTAFVNFAVPDPFTPEMLEGRPFYHYDGGLLDYSGIPNNLTFAMRLKQGCYTYACHAWLLTAAVLGVEADELGPVDVCKMDFYWQCITQAGFKLPEQLTSFLYPVNLPGKNGEEVPRHTTPRLAVRLQNSQRKAA